MVINVDYLLQNIWTFQGAIVGFLPQHHIYVKKGIFKMKPWLSIIVPVYNVEKYIDRCIESLLRQTFKDFEIILVDDGSTDSSGMICDFYAKKFEKIIKVVHKENGGLGSARNEGLRYAEGEYLDFVDSDDWMNENAYDLLYEKINKNRPDIVTYGYNKIYNGEIISKGVASFKEGFYSKEEIKSLILPDSIAQKKAFNQVVLPVQMSACMCLYKNSFLKEKNLHFESERVVLNEDWLFNICCLCRANSFFVVHEELYNYDTRESSLSMSFKPDSYERKCNLYRKYKEELEETYNLNTTTVHRLKNFWMESIYCCYIIELCAPFRDKERINEMLADDDFNEGLKTINLNNCTLKGIFFKLIVKLKLNFIFKCMYLMKKKRMRIK